MCCLFCCREHILNENAVSGGRVIYENVRYRADELAVLDDRASARECGQEGTTLFNGKFTVLEMIYITPLLIRKQNFKR